MNTEKTTELVRGLEMIYQAARLAPLNATDHDKVRAAAQAIHAELTKDAKPVEDKKE